MSKKSLCAYGAGLVSIPLLVLIAVGGFNLYEIVGAPKQAPIPATADNLTAGAQIYRDDCAACHGLPGQPQTHDALGMWPAPPQFFQRFHRNGPAPSAAEIDRFAARSAIGRYMTVRDGVPATGMPAFGHTLSQTAMWQVALMMAHTGDLPPAANAVLQPNPAPSPSGPGL